MRTKSSFKSDINIAWLASLKKIHLKIQQLISRRYHGVLFWHQAGINGPLRSSVGPSKWTKVWLSNLGSFWATNASGFAASITEFTVVEMAPEYMKDVQGFNLLGSGALASLPFIINLIVVFIACISLDYLLHKVRDSRTNRSSRLLSTTETQCWVSRTSYYEAKKCTFNENHSFETV